MIFDHLYPAMDNTNTMQSDYRWWRKAHDGSRSGKAQNSTIEDSIVGKSIPYAQVSNAHLQAHNHLDRHQEDEEWKCKHAHQDKLQMNNKHDQYSNNKWKISNIWYKEEHMIEIKETNHWDAITLK